MKKIILNFSWMLILLVVQGCVELPEFNNPYDNQNITPVNTGNANFSNFYVLGDGFTAGYQSGTLFQSAQEYSYSNLIAKQVQTNFEMPIITDPGLGGRMELQGTNPIVIFSNPNKGLEINANYPLPYNNLGIPGALVYDILFATNSTNCASAIFQNTPNLYFDLVLRNSGTSQTTSLQQTLSQNPTFLILWIGNNDVLGYATSGGVSPSAPTPVATFTELYVGICQQLVTSDAQVVVANIPNITSFPYFTTVGTIIGSNQTIPWGDLPYGLRYQKSNENGEGSGSATQSNFFNENVLIPFSGLAYIDLIGKSTGKYYRDRSIPVPAGVDTTLLFGYDPKNPWPNSLILDPDEISVVLITVNSYNSVIQTVANNLNFDLVDINSRFNQFKQNDNQGTIIDGFTFRTHYITGGLFSLDGIFPSSRANGIIANEFIKIINSKFNASIPLVNVSLIPESIVQR